MSLHLLEVAPVPAPAIPVVIGLDTSLTATGIASSTGWCEVIGYTDKKHPLTKLPRGERLQAMRTVRDYVISNIGAPDLVVIESPSLASQGGGSHERAWLWWRVYEYLTDAGIPVAELTPSQRALYATGKGNAAKSMVVDAVARRWPAWVTEGNDNAADAVALMAAGLDWLGHAPVDMPKAHRAALDKGIWPEVAR